MSNNNIPVRLTSLMTKESQIKEICEILDSVDDHWMQFAAAIGEPPSKIARVGTVSGNNYRASPTREILTGWQHRELATVQNLLNILDNIKCESAVLTVRTWIGNADAKVIPLNHQLRTGINGSPSAPTKPVSTPSTLKSSSSVPQNTNNKDSSIVFVMTPNGTSIGTGTFYRGTQKDIVITSLSAVKTGSVIDLTEVVFAFEKLPTSHLYAGSIIAIFGEVVIVQLDSSKGRVDMKFASAVTNEASLRLDNTICTFLQKL